MMYYQWCLHRIEQIPVASHIEADQLPKQLAYADKRGVQYVVFFGPNEQKEGVLMIRDMKTGKQDKIESALLIEYFVGDGR